MITTEKARMGRIIHLDLDIVTVYGYEAEDKYDVIIDSLVRSIEEGDDLPAVPVHRIAENEYVLTYDPAPGKKITRDGGHSRAMAYLITGVPMKSDLRPHGFLIPPPERVPIGKIPIADGTKPFVLIDKLYLDQLDYARSKHPDYRA